MTWTSGLTWHHPSFMHHRTNFHSHWFNDKGIGPPKLPALWFIPNKQRTTTAISRPLYRTTSINRQPQLEPEDFTGAKFYCPHALDDGNQLICIRENMLEFSSVVFLICFSILSLWKPSEKLSVDASTSTFLYVRADGVNVIVSHLQDVAETVQYYLNHLRVFGRQQTAHRRNHSQTDGIYHLRPETTALNIIIIAVQSQKQIITFCMSRRRREKYCGDARLCVCLSAATCLYYCTDSDVTWGSGIGCPSCALVGGFAIDARVALLWQQNANAKC